MIPEPKLSENQDDKKLLFGSEVFTGGIYEIDPPLMTFLESQRNLFFFFLVENVCYTS